MIRWHKLKMSNKTLELTNRVRQRRLRRLKSGMKVLCNPRKKRKHKKAKQMPKLQLKNKRLRKHQQQKKHLQLREK